MADTDKKRKALEEVFNQFDKDKSGKICASELRAAVRMYYESLNENPGDAEIDKDVGAILTACDTTKDGMIDLAEWFKFFGV